MKAIEALAAMEALFAVPGNYAKEYYGMTRGGDSCYGDHSQAVCWCLLGGLQKCTPRGSVLYHEVKDELTKSLRAVYGASNIITWNDLPGTTADMLVNVIRHARQRIAGETLSSVL